MRRSLSYDSSLQYDFKNKEIKICILGAGRAGHFHVKSLSINKQYRLLYVIDQNEENAKNLADIANSNYHTDLEWVFANVDFDAVIICTTTHTHYDLTMKCLNAGKHVLCEKPLGKTLDEIKDCFNLAKSLNLKLLVAYQKRFDENYNNLNELLVNNNYKPQNIRMINKDYPLPSLNYLKTSGGIVEDMICHDIDIVNLYMNFKVPEKVIAFNYTYNEELKSIGEIEAIEIMMQYKSGEIVTFSGVRTSNNGYDQRVELFGDFGMYTMLNQADKTIVKNDKEGGHTSKSKYTFTDRYNEAYKKELDYFYKMIIGGYKTIITQEHLMLTKKICIAINESIAKKKIVYFDNLREYKVDTPQYYLYRDMHKYQTLEYVKSKYNQYSKLNNEKMSISKALSMLNDYIDPSDPDVNQENLLHAYQTAERIRIKHPLDYELQIVGLIHDIGKILFKFGEKPWSVVGDTFVLGCKFPETIVYNETLQENPDYDKYYNSELGIYTSGCGLDKLYLSFGHDEYLYQVLQKNKNHKLSKKYIDIIRYHSFYPWHTGGSYKYFENENDKKILKDVIYFNQFDLYSKEDVDFVLTDEIKMYYENLLDKFFPKKLQF